MKVLNADFVTSAATGDGIPREDAPRVAFVGRSNVGKSSLINALSRARIARTSGAPGKTRLANFYRLTVEGGPGGPGRWAVYFVDLPGYGYARRSKPSPGRVADAATELAAVAESYFNSAPPTPGPETRRLALLLVDSRHPGQRSDIEAAGWLGGLGVTYHIIATKIDKLSRAERARNLQTLETSFGMPAVPVSATSGEGMDELWRTIARLARPAA